MLASGGRSGTFSNDGRRELPAVRSAVVARVALPWKRINDYGRRSGATYTQETQKIAAGLPDDEEIFVSRPKKYSGTSRVRFGLTHDADAAQFGGKLSELKRDSEDPAKFIGTTNEDE